MNERLVLQKLLGEFHDKLNASEGSVKRDAEFPKAPNKIKVVIGMRRAGKTYFVFQHIRTLLNEGIPLSRILYINFEDDRLLPLDQKRLANFIEAFYALYPDNHEHRCFIFLDEIQNVEGWPLVIRRIYDTKNVELFLTGSSAKLLSKEIATSLRGRSLATEIWPYSFKEFMRAQNIAINENLFDQKVQDKLTKYFHIYLSTGGFPEVTTYDTNVRQQTLQEYIDIALYRDIVERHHVKHTGLIKYMISFMLHNIGKPFSINKFYNDLKSQGYKVGKDVLYEYFSYIEDAYLAFAVSLYDPSIRKVQANPKKIYAIDPGIARALTLDYENNLGRLFENIVFLDLKRQGCRVNYYLTSQRYEVDFLVRTRAGHKKLFQVCWDMADENTYMREERALKIAEQELKINGAMITLESYLREGLNL